MDYLRDLFADHLINLGPQGGAEGGHLLFEGTPEALAESGTSTGGFLKEELARAAAFAEEDDEVDLDAMASDGEVPVEEGAVA